MDLQRADKTNIEHVTEVNQGRSRPTHGSDKVWPVVTTVGESVFAQVWQGVTKAGQSLADKVCPG